MKKLMKKKQQKKRVLQAIKIAVGSSAAIYVAEVLNLEYAISAGSIALLTLVTTKWETVKLSWFRLVTFLVSSVLAWIVFTQIQSEWLAYGIYIFLIVIVSEEFGWKATISVNAVIGMHFMAKRDFEASFVFNEFLLVLIGITVAVVLNLFYDYAGQRKDLVRNMRYTENRMQMILGAIAAYLADKEMQYDIWAAIRELESQIRIFIDDAYEYQDNTFQSHPEYYINYFEMRMKQCNTIHDLHYEMKRIRKMPQQALIISEYVLYMMDYVTERNEPTAQMDKLKEIFQHIKEDKLPTTREEFESQAMLYHILMDLEDFLVYKKRFVNSLDDKQKQRYWNQGK